MHHARSHSIQKGRGPEFLLLELEPQKQDSWTDSFTDCWLQLW